MGRLQTADGSYLTTADGAYIRAYPRGANGTCVLATPVSAFPFEDEIDTEQSPTDPLVPSCADGGEHAAWYAIDVPVGVTRLKLSVYGSFYGDTVPVVSVWRGVCGALTEIACSADGIGPLQAEVVPGETVFILIVSREVGAAGFRKLKFSAEPGRAKLQNAGEIQVVWVEITTRLPSDE